MNETTLDNMPASFVIGDAFKPTITMTGYESSEWIVILTFLGTTYRADVTGVVADPATPDAYEFDLNSATTALFNNEKYMWRVTVTEIATGNRYAVTQGRIEARLDLQDVATELAEAEAEQKSDIQKLYEKVRDAYLEMTSGAITMTQVSLNGKMVTFRDIGKITETFKLVRSMYLREKNGGTTIRTITYKFRR